MAEPLDIVLVTGRCPGGAQGRPRSQIGRRTRGWTGFVVTCVVATWVESATASSGGFRIDAGLDHMLILSDRGGEASQTLTTSGVTRARWGLVPSVRNERGKTKDSSNRRKARVEGSPGCTGGPDHRTAGPVDHLQTKG